MIVAVAGRQCGKSIVREYVETEEERRFRELIEMVEQLLTKAEEDEYVEAGVEPEDDEDWASLDCPCSRQSPGGHRIPWYTAGFT